MLNLRVWVCVNAVTLFPCVYILNHQRVELVRFVCIVLNLHLTLSVVAGPLARRLIFNYFNIKLQNYDDNKVAF